MRSIPLLAVNCTDVYDQIAAAKQQPRRRRLQAIRATVLSAYQEYEEAVPEVGELDPIAITELQKATLIHAYEVETAPMTKLRGELLKRPVAARCPFCGLSESSTLDHYLPKELNPQFAIFPKNLVPSCSPCNTRKRDKVLDEHTNVRLFVHPHFDVIPTMRFVKVNITLLPNALLLTYRLIRPAGMALKTFQHLQAHFRLLDLADRYRLMALEHLRGQHQPLMRNYGVGEDADRVAAGLIEKAGDFENQYGENYWLAVLYRALAAKAAFCDGGFGVLKKIQ